MVLQTVRAKSKVRIRKIYCVVGCNRMRGEIDVQMLANLALTEIQRSNETFTQLYQQAFSARVPLDVVFAHIACEDPEKLSSHLMKMLKRLVEMRRGHIHLNPEVFLKHFYLLPAALRSTGSAEAVWGAALFFDVG